MKRNAGMGLQSPRKALNDFLFTIFSEIFSNSGTFDHDFGQIRPSNGSTHPYTRVAFIYPETKKLKNLYSPALLPDLETFKNVDFCQFRDLDIPMALHAHTRVALIFSEV